MFRSFPVAFMLADSMLILIESISSSWSELIFFCYSWFSTFLCLQRVAVIFVTNGHIFPLLYRTCSFFCNISVRNGFHWSAEYVKQKPVGPPHWKKCSFLFLGGCILSYLVHLPCGTAWKLPWNSWFENRLQPAEHPGEWISFWDSVSSMCQKSRAHVVFGIISGTLFQRYGDGLASDCV